VDKPTKRWREDIPEDSVFTEESVSEAEHVLDEYQDRLHSIQNSDQEKILFEVQRVILELNKLGGYREGTGTEPGDYYGKYPVFFDTMEREELCEFIIALAEDAGLKVNPNDYEGGDITYQWRDW
jgi:hypothetical protein